jgi:hypothetical protein
MVEQGAAAQVVEHGEVAIVCEPGELDRVGRVGEANDSVIAGVHVHDEGGVRSDRGFVIGEARLVGGADLAQPDAAGGHDLRQAIGTADLD